jgi:hypothetical protein
MIRAAIAATGIYAGPATAAGRDEFLIGAWVDRKVSACQPNP